MMSKAAIAHPASGIPIAASQRGLPCASVPSQAEICTAVGTGTIAEPAEKTASSPPIDGRVGCRPKPRAALLRDVPEPARR
jgi:hypothetical protein